MTETLALGVVIFVLAVLVGSLFLRVKRLEEELKRQSKKEVESED